MTAPPLVDPAGGRSPAAGDGPDGGTPPDPSALHRTGRGSTVPLVDDLDPSQARPDPAADVVAIGEVPPVRRPVRPERRRLPDPPTDRLRAWLVTAGLALIGGLLRLWNVGQAADGGVGGSGSVPTPLFDEKYYAVQAAEVIRNGGIEDNQAFGVVVHPPLGKQIIALGEMLLGYNPTGWRISSVVAGTIIIALMVRVVRRMTRSTLVGAIAGVLVICDGVSHVQARTALLDVFQELFILAAFACLIADRDQVRARLNRSVADPDAFLPTRGPGFWRRSGERAGVALGARWWRFGCGLFLGLTTSVKWSGFYWIAAFGILSVVWDITARREAGIRTPVVAVIRRDLLPSLWSLAVVPIATYVASWWAWFASEDGWARHIFVADTENWTSTGLQKIAAVWHNSLWQWTWKMLDFHSSLLTPTNPADRHPWESKPWTWPIGTRPVLYYVSSGQSGCGDGRTDCIGRIFLIGTPALWWVSLFVAGWALWRAIGRLDWRYAAVLVGYGAGYVPWFFNLDRQMYFFYVTPLAPFLVIGISLVLGDVLGRARAGVEKRFLSVAVVAVYVGLVVANFIWLLPILQGDPITQDRLTAETWLPSWG
ncbi:dolichyl-phosphate-mannose--protein mannosyltransferase [Nakamurella endophytica]|uniref:Polyprenol-phosphate-mannose--protein mannosyltransferase n=1 Tax=Nakamurella endophytica TaxID=1748367 RepID=A0A917SLC1_9ACTN|nr:phospholipid carrier-dependent glycosyltransferase [Nakamurella endophytica]GGL87813.1 hypothetical protein GCM10011594_04330 [Nakamurella endophytica]